MEEITVEDATFSVDDFAGRRVWLDVSFATGVLESDLVLTIEEARQLGTALLNAARAASLQGRFQAWDECNDNTSVPFRDCPAGSPCSDLDGRERERCIGLGFCRGGDFQNLQGDLQTLCENTDE